MFSERSFYGAHYDDPAGVVLRLFRELGRHTVVYPMVQLLDVRAIHFRGQHGLDIRFESGQAGMHEELLPLQVSGDVLESNVDKRKLRHLCDRCTRIIWHLRNFTSMRILCFESKDTCQSLKVEIIEIITNCDRTIRFSFLIIM